MKTKVCGMRDEANIKDVIDLGIDWMGLIFYSKSPRCVMRKPRIDKRGVKLVGVFVGETVDNIVGKIADYDLDLVQLHGTESPDMVGELRARADVGIIKAISVASAADIAKARDYEGAVDYFLFDTKCPTVGGSGEQFDWSVLSHYDGATPFLLSGGIGSGDARRIAEFRHPQFFGIDLNSRFELGPGVKDVGMLRAFLDELKTNKHLAPPERRKNRRAKVSLHWSEEKIADQRSRSAGAKKKSPNKGLAPPERRKKTAKKAPTGLNHPA